MNVTVNMFFVFSFSGLCQADSKENTKLRMKLLSSKVRMKLLSSKVRMKLLSSKVRMKLLSSKLRMKLLSSIMFYYTDYTDMKTQM